MAEFIEVADATQLPPGAQLAVRARDREIALFNIEGRIHAIDNVCLHRGGPLAEGLLEGTIITCPWHLWGFDVETGRCTLNDHFSQEVFPVKSENGKILVAV